MINQKDEIRHALDVYDMVEDCGCTENYWCKECSSYEKDFSEIQEYFLNQQ